MIFRLIFTGLLIVFSANRFLYSQDIKNLKMSHPVKFGAENKTFSVKDFSGITDTITVVGIMVQFQEDNTDLTTGNGKFDLSNKYFDPALNRDTVIDAPPHNESYFSDHLQFLQNYFYKSSDGQAVIKYQVYANVVTLPKEMREYSPQRNEPFNKLGELYKDSWSRADSFIDFSQYDPASTSFFLFHAGTGKDIDLTSQFGFDPTPFDIPSVYLGLNNLREFYGTAYNGYQTQEGFLIQNTSIIPSTENRTLESLGGDVFLQLSINGLMCASFGSYLGLPDLFDTEEGSTRIGRFGLMDGQSIFNFDGIFPAEPSAWEKYYLGWVNPTVISAGDLQYNIRTSSSNLNTSNTMYKVLMNSKEYFLIENRNRNPQNNGVQLNFTNHGVQDSVTFTQDIEGFQFGGFSTWKVDGNVTDVSNFDWSLPGSINDTSNYRGGILIWHIDENIIDVKISSNTINNDIDRKGIDLEEAKGAQEIGVVISTPFGAVTGEGTLVDYWFNGNHFVPTTIYKNAFTPTSFPNSLSNSGANSKIFITEFSDIDTVMNFRVKIGDGVISQLPNFPKFIGIDTSSRQQPIAFNFYRDNAEEIFVNSNSRLFGFTTSGSEIFPSSNIASLFSPSVINLDRPYIVSVASDGRGLILTDSSNSSTNVSPNSEIISAPPLVVETGSDTIFAGFQNGEIRAYRGDSLFTQNNSSVIVNAQNSVNLLSRTRTGSLKFAAQQFKFVVTGQVTSNNSDDTVKVGFDNSLYLNGNKIASNYGLTSIDNPPILADLNSDSKQEILLVSNGKLFAFNGGGSASDNFPVSFGTGISSGLAVADVGNDNILDVIFTTKDGDLYAYGINGKVSNGFPIKTGISRSFPSLANFNDTLGIVIAGIDGYLYAYKTSTRYDAARVLWKNYLKDQYLTNNNYQTFGTAVTYSGGLPEDRVYNWPNPVYEGRTFIRYYLNGSASTVKIKIMDLAGELVATLDGTTTANTDNEVAWDVSKVQSGIYYAMVEADVSGSKESKIIKIAVIK